MKPNLANFDYIREIPNYPGYYITKDGKIWSTRTNRGHNCRWLKPQKLNYGHLYVSLNCTSNRKLIHRLVLETFLGSCPKGMECCHNNGIPNDNRLENLRWDTHSNNHKDKVKHGRWINPTGKGELNGRSKLTEQSVKRIIYLYQMKGFSQRKLAKIYGIGKTTIAHVVNGDTWRHVIL